MFRKILAILAFSFLFFACAASSDEEINIPLAIDEIKSSRIDQGLARVILFNTEVVPRMYIELIQAPNRTLLDRKIIKSINLNGQTLDFDTAGSVFIEGIKIYDNMVNFKVYYQHEGRPQELAASCIVNSTEKKLRGPVCKGIDE
jgi:hypothetical protein